MYLNSSSMWRGGLLWCLLVGAVLASERTRSDTTPVAKVISLLKKLSLQVQEEGKREAAGYDKYACFCKEQSNSKAHTIEKSRLLIEELQASIDALDGEITELDSDVVTARGSITSEQGEANSTQVTRDTTFAAYETARANLTEGISAIEGAIQSLKASKDDVKEATAASLLARKALSYASAAWVSEKGGAAQNPKKYEYRSNDIIATLQDLLRTFKQELQRVDEEEAGDRHAHEMTEGARANRISALQAEVDQKSELSAKKGEQKAEDTALKTDEVAAQTADQAFLDELTAACQAKAAAWDTRSKTRAGEITAITEAVGILEGMGDLYNTNKKLVGLVQGRGAAQKAVKPHAPVLLQVRRAQPVHDSLRPVAKLLNDKASALKSPALAALAEKIATNQPTDHFVEVRSLINDLIAKLEAEATAEATQKSFCDTEMSAAITKRDEQRANMESNQASIDQTRSEIAKLEEDIATLGEEIAELYKAKKELTDLRDIAKANNAKTVTDADAGATAVRQAITVLQNFYGTQLLQKRYTPPNSDREGNTVADLAPETFEGEYSGKQAESKGVLGLLEVIASDFERTSSTTTEAETQQEQDYQQELGTMQGEIDAKEKDKGTFETDVETKKTVDLVGFEDDLHDAKKLHADAISQLEVLKASCVDSSESYEERRAHRKQEIEALKEALTILENWKS